MRFDYYESCGLVDISGDSSLREKQLKKNLNRCPIIVGECRERLRDSDQIEENLKRKTQRRETQRDRDVEKEEID